MPPTPSPRHRTSPAPREGVTRRATSALLVAVLAIALGSGPASALGADSTPAPTLPGSLEMLACPAGQTPTRSTAPPPTPAPANPPAAANPPPPVDPGVPPPTANPSVTTQPDGSIVTTTCAIAPPTPMVGPLISPAHTVGGPKLAGAGVILAAPAGVPAPPDVTDVSWVISDLQTGVVLAAKNPHALLLPASTLKTLLALVTLPALDPASVVTASRGAASADGTRVGILEGNPYTVDQLFTGLVLVSGNDAAYALAEAYGGQASTVMAMNQQAGALGAWDTVAVDPSGLDADGQRSSAYDLALFGRAVMQLPAFRRYAMTPAFTFPGGTDRLGKVYPPFAIQNHNALLERYPGAIGVKNGYTTGARHTFIGAATRGGRTLLVTQMGGVVVPSWQPTAALLDWAFANADQLSPVGRLVAPGAPQPPEWRGEQGRLAPAVVPSVPPTAPTTATDLPTTTTTISAPTTPPVPTSTAPTSTDATSAAPTGTAPLTTTAGSTRGGSTPPPAVAFGPGGDPVSAVLASARTAASTPSAYAVLAVVLAAFTGWGVARRRRRSQP